jgi:TRAP-type C4-dicarboxylate transport system substrate-binding protein
MRKQKSLVIVSTVLLFTLVFITVSAVNGFASQAKPIKLEFVSFLPLSNKVEYQFLKKEFIDLVNQRTKGALTIKVRGGPEAIPPFDIGVSVQKGVIDMATVPPSFFESVVPGSLSHAAHSEYTAKEEREKGIIDYVQKLYNKGGLHYLGRSAAGKRGFFFLFMNKRVEKPDDFKGLKLGGSPLFQGFYKGLGVSTSFLAIPEYHSAMERGVVDGLCSSIYVGHQFGLAEVTKYIIRPGFYRGPVVVILNLKTWNKIPGHLQNMLTETMAEFESKYVDFETEERAAGLKLAEKKGVKMIQLSPEVSKWYLNAATEGAWSFARGKWGDIIPEIRKVVTK